MARNVCTILLLLAAVGLPGRSVCALISGGEEEEEPNPLFRSLGCDELEEKLKRPRAEAASFESELNRRCAATARDWPVARRQACPQAQPSAPAFFGAVDDQRIMGPFLDASAKGAIVFGGPLSLNEVISRPRRKCPCRSAVEVPCPVQNSSINYLMCNHMANALGVLVSELNARGGILFSGRRRPLVVITADDGGDKVRVANVTKALLSNPVVGGRPVDAILGPYLSDLTDQSSLVANQMGALLMSAGASATKVFQNRSLSFGMLSPATTFLQYGVILLYEKGVRSIGLLLEEDLVSRDYCDGVRTKAKELGIRLAVEAVVNGTSQYKPANSARIASALDEFRASKPDAIVGCSKYDNCAEFLKQAARDPTFYVQAMLFTLCVTDVRFKDLPIEHRAYVMGVTPWFEGDTQKDDLFGWSPADFDSRYRKFFGQSPPYQAVAAFAGAQLLAKAIEDSDSLEPKRVAATLARMRYRTVLGNLSFDENRQNVVPLLTVQHTLDKKTQYGFSTHVVTAQDAVIPMPSRAQVTCEIGEPPLYTTFRCALYGGCKSDGTCWSPPCAAGFHTISGGNRTTVCEECRPGSFSSSGTATVCTVCSPGTRMAPLSDLSIGS